MEEQVLEQPTCEERAVVAKPVPRLLATAFSLSVGGTACALIATIIAGVTTIIPTTLEAPLLLGDAALFAITLYLFVEIVFF